MKKMMAIVMSMMLLVVAMGCGGSTAGTSNVGGVGADSGKEEADKGGSAEVSAEMLEAMGISLEEFAAMEPAQQEALMTELGMVLEQQKKEEKETKPVSKTYTPDDVMAGGSYVVVMGDYLNSITLYYENGKLVKIEESFRKNSEEPEEHYVYEGDSLKSYTFNFINWAEAPLQEILDGMKDYGGFGQYRISKSE